MSYQHLWLDGSPCNLPVGKVVCVGRNYVDHAKELNNPIPASPILFIKPATAIVPFKPSFSLPTDRGECHHETEIALLIGAALTKAKPDEVAQAIVGLGVGLDLTLRNIQSDLKQKGYPWEQAKAFDGACPLTPFVPRHKFAGLNGIAISLDVNGETRQSGCSDQMLCPILELVAAMSDVFTLQPGDVVLTGTPSGVAPLQPGDDLQVALDGRFQFVTQVLADT